MISASLPEPLCDVVAQLAALVDPRHPKDAVWLARGTWAPEYVPDVAIVRLASGALFTADMGKARHVERHQSDDALADVLGYVEPKWRISGAPMIVRALGRGGCIITEMACSASHVGRAVAALEGHGTVRLASIEQVLRRRRELCAMRVG